MPSNPRIAADRINRAVVAWSTLRPEKSFSGMTLDQFKQRVQASFDARASLEQFENQVVAAQARRDDSDRDSLAVVALVVNAVKGDPEEGEDGELYETMGYVRRSERRSGLRRPRRAAAIAAK